MRFAGLLVLLLLGCGLVGCSQTRILTVITDPPDATIKVDGAYQGRGQITVPMDFESASEVHVVTASRLGYQDEPVQIRRDLWQDPLRIKLEPLSRRVTFHIVPVAAMVTVDGKPATDRPTQTISKDLEFSVDDKNNWITHTVKFERPGFATLTKQISWVDPDQSYTVRLLPQSKALDITTTPPGAAITLDGKDVGETPLHLPSAAFPVDLASGEAIPQTLIVSKAGYDPIERTLTWDEGNSEYHVDLVPKTKSFTITTNPPGATVTLEGKELPHDDKGNSVAKDVPFPPTDDSGTLTTYSIEVILRGKEADWAPTRTDVGWENGKDTYRVALKEILTRAVGLLSVKMERKADVWTMKPEPILTLAMKDASERVNQPQPKRITDVHAIIDSFAVSPDGSKMIYATLSGTDESNFRSQLTVIDLAGNGGPQQFSDGKSLDIMPTYTAAGDQIFFSSNRAGRRLSIWSMDANGAPAFTQHTSGGSYDLWPDVDADPKPRLYFESHVDTRDDPRLYSTQLHTVPLTDLTHIGGTQPRVSPTFDKVLFTSMNDKTKKRDIYIMPSAGGPATNLTNTPDVDEYAPTWSSDGSRVAFASDHAADHDNRHNYDIWVMDVSQPQQQTQVTSNGSFDDNPVWDPNGAGLYFRSNRGGEWAIWRIDVGQ